MDPPPGFEHRRADGADLWLRADLADGLVAAGFGDPAALRIRAVSAYRGRGEPFGVDAPGCGRVFVRGYLHGGLLGGITRDRFASDARFLAELAVHAAAAERRVPVCEVLGVASRSAGLGLRRGWILLREIPGARDLLAALAPGTPARERRDLAVAAGRAVRAFHDAGFTHPDLHVKNLLVAPTTDRRQLLPRVLVADLDGAERLPGGVPRERRIAELFRLERHAAKQRDAGHGITRTDRLRLLRAYAGPDWPGRDALRALTARLRRHIATHAPLRSRASEVPA